jgi:hypothetical protein
MMSLLREHKDAKGVDLDRILVEVYPERPEYGQDHAKEIFQEVNKAEPVKLVDMPGVAKGKDRKIITDGADRLNEKFPEMFSNSQRCRSPNVHIDNLRDALFAADVIPRHNIKTAAALEAWLLGQNDTMAEKYKDEKARKSAAPKALEKATKFNFYLGLDASWYYN